MFLLKSQQVHQTQAHSGHQQQQQQQGHQVQNNHPQTITVVSNPNNSALLTVTANDANNSTGRPQFGCR